MRRQVGSGTGGQDREFGPLRKVAVTGWTFLLSSLEYRRPPAQSPGRSQNEFCSKISTQRLFRYQARC